MGGSVARGSHSTSVNILKNHRSLAHVCKNKESKLIIQHIATIISVFSLIHVSVISTATLTVVNK